MQTLPDEAFEDERSGEGSPCGGEAPSVCAGSRGADSQSQEQGGGQSPPIEPRSIDEEMARVGLSVKLLFDQTPELVAMTHALEHISQDLLATAAAEVAAQTLARAFVLLRAIRGTAGIKWAAARLLEETPRALLRAGEDTQALKELAASLLQAIPEHGGCWNGIGHREGRHMFLSGRYALEALSAFPEGAAQAARLLSVVTRAMLEASPQQPSIGGQSPVLDIAHILLAFTACEGRLPLAVNRHGTACYANRYNALNAGWMLLGWGWRTSRVRLPELDGVLLHTIKNAQSAKAKSNIASLGLDMPGMLEAKQAALAALSTPPLPVRSDPLERPAPPGLFLGNVLAHLCEVAQLRAVLADDVIGRVCRMDADKIRTLILPVLHAQTADEERLDGSCRASCLTVQVFAAVEQALQQLPTRRLRSKAALAAVPALARVKRCKHVMVKGKKQKLVMVKGKKLDGRGRSQRPGVSLAVHSMRRRKDRRRKQGGKVRGAYKEIIKCSVCGREVRRDNLSRHANSKLCAKRSTEYVGGG